MRAQKSRQAWEEFDDPWSDFEYDYDYGYGRARRPSLDLHKTLAPLIDRLNAYDEIRLKLEREGGEMHHLFKLTKALKNEFALKTAWDTQMVALVYHQRLRSLLKEIGYQSGSGLDDLHLEIRQLRTKLPVYFLCRSRRSYYADYGLIVEDLYRSPGYPVQDERFVKLMDIGHERYYIRLAQFRNAVRKQLDHKASENELDQRIYNLGRHVFESAWHEDQRPALIAADTFDLQQFRQTIELLYLVLSGDLCELRTQVDDFMLTFFQQVYPQPTLVEFLAHVPDLPGGAINDISKLALKSYARLSKAFGRFLRVEVPWGSRQTKVPLFKLLFGNFSRMEPIAEALKTDEWLRLVISRLEQESASIAEDVIEVVLQAA